MNVLGFLFSSFLIAASFYFQYVEGLPPCPLCILQRVAVMGLALVFFWGIWLKRRRWLMIQSFIAIPIISLGLYASARQIYLQHLPKDQIPTCGPSLDVMIHHLPWQDTLKLLFAGSGDCAKIDWTFLGLSMPEWTFAAFMGFLVMVIVSKR